MNGYNIIAPIYDILVKIVFGNKIKVLQKEHLHYIPDNSNVLILGGGTGWILEEIDLIKKGLNITYIDASSEMIRFSKNRLVKNNSIHFILGTESDIPNQKFEVLITNFYLDLFPHKILKDQIKKLSSINFNIWIWTDFIPNKYYRWLEKLMIIFFRVFTGLKNKSLYNYESIINVNTDYVTYKKATKMNGFIVSVIMKKASQL